MRFSSGLRNAQANIIETTIGASALLQLRTGDVPSGVDDANTGTLLAEVACPSDYFTAASGGAIAKNGSWSATAVANGLASHFRLYNNAGDTPAIDGLVSMPWAAATDVTSGQQMHAGGNVYRCATGGTTHGSVAPSGTGSGITDNTVTWDYAGPVDMTIDNVDLAIGQTVTVSTFGITIPE